MKKTNGLVIAVVAIVLLAGGIFAFSNRGNAPTDVPVVVAPEAPAILHGELVFSAGETFKERDAKWVEIKSGEILNEGDKIKTNAASKATILFDDGSLVRLDANTEIVIEKIQKTEIKIAETKGSTYNRVAKADGRNYMVSSNGVDATALGTAFLFDVSGKEVAVTMIESKTKVDFDKGTQEVAQGEKVKINVDKKEIKKENLDKAKLVKQQFVAWNKTEDEKEKYEMGIFEGAEKAETTDAVEKTAEEKSESSVVNSITLSGTGASVSWKVDGTSASGFKLVWSKNAEPAYPTRSGDKYLYYTDPATRSGKLTAFSGTGTYYVRVCEYLGGACGKYSNQITVKLEAAEEKTEPAVSDAVKSISLSVSGATPKWSVNGYSKNGFKVVWSKNANPTYPTRSGDQYIYLASSSAASTTLTPFSGAGTYYVRVCEYLGGKCGVYSNQATVQLGSEEPAAAAVSSISLIATGKNASWQVNGYSKSGFKLVWSKNSGPTYPTRGGDQYQYYSDSGTTSGTMNAFDGAGTYYVRVCEYLGGACGVYSNQVTVTLE